MYSKHRVPYNPQLSIVDAANSVMPTAIIREPAPAPNTVEMAARFKLLPASVPYGIGIPEHERSESAYYKGIGKNFKDAVQALTHRVLFTCTCVGNRRGAKTGLI